MKKQVMRIATDSRPMGRSERPGNPIICFSCISCLLRSRIARRWQILIEVAVFGYGEVKKALAEAADKFFQPAREKRAELEADPEYVRQVLGDGAAMARKKAAVTLRRVQEACGVK